MNKEKLTREDARAWLKNLFDKYHRGSTLQKRAFRALYTNIEEEKHLPATTELTRSDIGKLVFKRSAKSCYEALEKFFKYDSYITFSNLKEKPRVTEAGGAQLDGTPVNPVWSSTKGVRLVSFDGNGNVATPARKSCEHMRLWMGDLFKAADAFMTNLMFRGIVFENSTPEERAALTEEAERLVSLLRTVADVTEREFRKPRAISAEKRVAKNPIKRRPQAAEKEAVL